MAQAMASQTLDGHNVSPAPVPTPEDIAGNFPQFEILGCLGRGGMGVVYKAIQKSLNRMVAIKILAPERVGQEKFAERFAREAQTLAQLNHPNIVTVFDYGETGGLYYFVMEFADGVNLRDLLSDGKLEPQQALAIVPPVCEALQYAHDKGIVHRDIKPENLLLDKEGRVKIADFGIAALVGAEGETSGTPPYMAPEQADSSPEVDHRADIYALGVVLYEMLTGERPRKDVVSPSRKVQVDVRLDEIVLRALEKNPELRYQQASIFKTQVETIASSSGREPVFTQTVRSKADHNQSTLPPAELNPWQPTIAFLGVVICFLLFIVGFILPYPANLPPLIIAPIGFIVAGLKLAGLWPLPSPMFPKSNWTGRNLKRNRPDANGRLPDTELNPWQPVIAFLGVIICSPLFIVGFNLPLNLPPLVLPLIGIGMVVASLKLAGLWPFPSPLFPKSKWAGRNLPGNKTHSGQGGVLPVATPSNINQLVTPPVARLSRTAIFGACWAAFPLIFIPLCFLLFRGVNTHGDTQVHSARGPMSMMLIVLIFGVATPLGTTILGWVAASQIRHAAGKIYGMGLAVFDGLLFPLLALDAAIISAMWLVDNHLRQSASPDVSLSYREHYFLDLSQLLLLLVACIAVDYFIIRGVWKTMNSPADYNKPNNIGTQDNPVHSPLLTSSPREATWEQIHNIVRKPAVGICAVGVINLVVHALIIFLCGNRLSLLLMTLDGFIILAGLGMMRMEHRKMALVASILVMIDAPGNLIGLAIGIWSLGVLSRDNVRSAFDNTPRKKSYILYSILGVLIAILIYIIGLAGITYLKSHSSAYAVADFRCRVFIVDAKHVDQSIPPGMRHSGVQANVRRYINQGNSVAQTPGQIKSGTSGEESDIASQIAEISPDTLANLLGSMAADPGVLSDRTHEVSSVWWPPGMADSWGYAIGKPFSGSGGGAGFCGYRLRDGVREIRLEYGVNGLMDSPSRAIITKYLYEGKAPTDGALAVLVPYQLNDGTKWYLVITYEVTDHQAGKNLDDRTLPAIPKPACRALLRQGTVELLALAPHPSTNAQSWYPDGSPASEPFPFDERFSSGYDTSSTTESVTQEIAIRVRTRTGSLSSPVLRFDKDARVICMGSILHPENPNQTALLYLQGISCPRETKSTNIKLGVAEGDWERVISTEKPRISYNAGSIRTLTSDESGVWEAHVQMAEGKEGDVVLAFTYSAKDDFETRIAYVKNDGTVVQSRSDGLCGTDHLINSMISMSAADYALVKEFQLQKRRYEWVEFRNVSLQLGNKTSVETVNAP